jgi:hypothetical protein
MHESANQLVAKLKALRFIVGEKFHLDVEDVVAAGAVSVSVPATCVAAAGTIALTLANGLEGQVKFVWLKTAGGTATMTPVNLYNGTTVAFDHVNDAWIGIFHAGEWHTILAGSLGATIG